MRKLLMMALGLLAGLASANPVLAVDRAPSVQRVGLLEDWEGHGAVSRMVELMPGLPVVEERIRHLCGTIPYQRRDLPPLSPEKWRQLEDLVASDSFNELPRVVPKSEFITPDAPRRLINVRIGTVTHVVSWEPLEEAPDTPDVKVFRAAWDQIVKLSGIGELVAQPSRPCREGE